MRAAQWLLVGSIITRQPQTADKARKRKNLCQRKETGRDSCLLCWLRRQNAVTYSWVSSLFCRLAALPCELFSGLQSVDFVNILCRQVLSEPADIKRFVFPIMYDPPKNGLFTETWGIDAPSPPFGHLSPSRGRGKFIFQCLALPREGESWQPQAD